MSEWADRMADDPWFAEEHGFGGWNDSGLRLSPPDARALASIFGSIASNTWNPDRGTACAKTTLLLCERVDQLGSRPGAGQAVQLTSSEAHQLGRTIVEAYKAVPATQVDNRALLRSVAVRIEQHVGGSYAAQVPFTTVDDLSIGVRETGKLIAADCRQLWKRTKDYFGV